MKKIWFVLLFSFITITLTEAQSCGYLLMTNNAEVEMSMYDKKGNSSGKVIYKVISSNGTEAKVNSKVFNEKGKELTTAEGTYKCDGKKFAVDMRAMLPGEQAKSMNMKDMEVKTNDATLYYPTNLSVGSSLPDNEFVADTYTGGMKIMSMNLRVTDRKVEGKENITTPAGTFECYKISSNQNVKAIFNISMQTIEWFSPNVGIIKTETYRKGDLVSSTLITKIVK
ncbi:MAG: DUF3108 domain-containing protein [Arcicella sp.]|jgi:hypothetical protein|nr:DUF3108 domain-containing protein [Arcicella sp.]